MFKKIATILAFCAALVLVGMTGCIGNPSQTLTGTSTDFNYSFSGKAMSLSASEVDWFTTEKGILGGTYQKEHEMTFDNNNGINTLVVKASGGMTEVIANGQKVWSGNNPDELKFTLSSSNPITMNGKEIVGATFTIDQEDNEGAHSLVYTYKEQKN